MLKFNKDDFVDTDTYEQHLGCNGYICYDREKMQRFGKYEESSAASANELALDVMRHNSGWLYNNLSRDPVISYLVNIEKCPEHYFKTKKTKALSLDTEKVLKKLVSNNYATEFLGLYMLGKSKTSKAGKLCKLASRQNTPAGSNRDGVDIHKIFFNFSQQKNLRYYYNNEDIIGIPKDCNSCITVEDGYFLAWGDFAQSDFRIAYNLFMRSPENDKIMSQCEDKYEALARICAKAEGGEFSLEKFKKDRQQYKRLTLATVYGTRDSVVAEEDTFIKRFVEFLRKCPNYVEYERRLRARVALKLPIIVSSYFGHQETIALQYNQESTIYDALNSPVQSATSEIVILTVNEILRRFYELGYTSEDISVYYTRHDEPIFKIKESVLKDVWVLNQASEIIVDNWSPLAMDFKFGYYYKEPDPELTSKVEAVYNANIHKIEQYSANPDLVIEYCPVANMLELTCTVMKTPDNKAILGLYDNLKNEIAYFICNKDDDETIATYLQGALIKLEPKIFEKGYRGVHVITDMLEKDFFYGNTYFRLTYENGGSTYLVGMFVRYMLIKYCRKSGLEIDLLPPSKSDGELILSAKDLLS